MRAPGMTLMRMPLFTWTALCTSVLMVFAFPALTVVLRMLALDRYARHAFLHQRRRRQHDELRQPVLDLGPSGGLHPDPAGFRHLFGGRRDLLAASGCSATPRWSMPRRRSRILSFTVWLHHFFTMGASANVNAFFGIATMIIAIPTGVKIFNWLFTMYRGRISFDAPMLWTLGFIVTFVIGGMTGVLLAVPPADYRAAQHDCSWSRISTT